MVTIYGLIDPRDGIVRYVGQTRIDPRRRLMQHRSSSNHSLVRQWIRDLRDIGVAVEAVVLEVVPDADADDAEVRWIKRSDGGDIKNVTHTKNHSPHAEALAVHLAERRELARVRAEERATTDATRATPDPVTIAELKAFRERHGWSQARLARELGYHYSNISLWEKGKRAIPPVVRLALERLDS